MAILGQMILNGGSYGQTRILSEDSVRAMLTNLNAGLGGSAARGLGWQLEQWSFMDAMTSPVTTGHTGYTGTSLVVDPLSDTLLVLHTNRVHPTRNWGTASSYRRAPARELARAVPVKPAVGPTDWFSGQRDATTVTLTAPLASRSEEGELSFRLWYDTESTDIGRVLASDDEGATWQPVPLQFKVDNTRWTTEGTFSGFSGRQWLSVRADLPDGTTHVRWSYASDGLYQGRGVYVDGVRIEDRSGLLFNSERSSDAAALQAVGWVEATN